MQNNLRLRVGSRGLLFLKKVRNILTEKYHTPKLQKDVTIAVKEQNNSVAAFSLFTTSCLNFFSAEPATEAENNIAVCPICHKQTLYAGSVYLDEICITCKLDKLLREYPIR